MVARSLPLALVVAALASCGEGERATPEDDVRDVVTRFGQASAKKDYQTICDQLLAAALVKNVEQYGLPCELAFQRSIGDVEAPRLRLGEVRVDGERASARVTTTAAGQQPSIDTLALRRVGGEWRIAALS